MPSCYNKNQLPLLTSTQLVFFGKVHVKRVRGTPTTSQVNYYNVLFPIYEEGKVDMGRGVYDMNNQPKRATFKYEQEELFCLGVAKVESKEDGTITGKCFLVYDYTGKYFHHRCLQKRNAFLSSRIRNLTLSSSPWVEKKKTYKTRLC